MDTKVDLNEQAQEALKERAVHVNWGSPDEPTGEVIRCTLLDAMENYASTLYGDGSKLWINTAMRACAGLALQNGPGVKSITVFGGRQERQLRLEYMLTGEDPSCVSLKVLSADAKDPTQC